MYQKANRLKLRFNSDKGLLLVEDLWDLPLTQLNKIAKTLNKELKTAEEEDFLEDASSEDKITKLRFDIVIDVLNTKKEENKRKNEATERKAKKEKLLDILSKKQDESLENMSEDDLKKAINDLD